MILQALYQLAHDEKLIGDPDFEMKPIRYIIAVGDGGKFLSITDTNHVPGGEQENSKKKPKPVAKVFFVPRDLEFTMKSGTKTVAGPLYDKREYVFGIPEENYKGDVKADRAEERRIAFLERTRGISSVTQDDAVAAVVQFLETVATEGPPELPADCGPGDLFTFSYYPDHGAVVTVRPAVKEWWKRERSRTAVAAGDLQCLVTSQTMEAPGLFPKIKRVPGVAGDISLVSFDAKAFVSYGLKKNENAPVSREASESIATALNRLLHPAYPNPDQSSSITTLSPRSFRITPDTALCYWSSSTESDFADNLIPVFNVEVADVKEEVWRRLWSGKAPDPKTTSDLSSQFYGLTITGQQGRAMVRDWFETTIGKAQNNVAQHFAELAIVRNAPWKKGEDPPPAIGLKTLLASIAVNGDQDNIPDTLASQFVRAAFTGTIYPIALLQRAVERARAESGRSEWLDLQRRDARAAIIKAVLNRRQRLQPSPSFMEVKEDMDPNNRNPGYVLGCLMAVLERLQQEALGEDVNATVVDKYFSGASAAPRAIFDRLLKNARHHARKARDERTRNNKSPAVIFFLERLINELMTAINVDHKLAQKSHVPIGFPLTLPIEQQGLFVIGYHHMRHFLWMNNETRTKWEAEHPDAPPAFLWQSKKSAEAVAS